jgi:four helix bundle protein
MRSHKGLLAWLEARLVTKAVIQLSRTWWKPQLAVVFGQLQRSSLSVQLNIAEGYGFGPGPRMGSHLRIAYASAIETQDLLKLLHEEDLIGAIAMTPLITNCDKSQKLITGLLRRYGWRTYSGAKEKG